MMITDNIKTKLNIDTEEVNNINQKEKGVVKTDKPYLFKKGMSGNPKGRPKNKPFSLKDDLLKSLKQLKKTNKRKYWELITSYWEDPKMRTFLMEQVDGKARQSLEVGAIQSNPIRVLEITSE